VASSTRSASLPGQLHRDDAARFLAFVEQHAVCWYSVCLCALKTGMRLGELLGLQWADVDRDPLRGPPRFGVQGDCQLTPYSRSLVFAHRGPRVFTRKEATCFRAFGGDLFSPDRGPPTELAVLHSAEYSCLF
jgi:integrase